MSDDDTTTTSSPPLSPTDPPLNSRSTLVSTIADELRNGPDEGASSPSDVGVVTDTLVGEDDGVSGRSVDEDGEGEALSSSTSSQDEDVDDLDEDVDDDDDDDPSDPPIPAWSALSEAEAEAAYQTHQWATSLTAPQVEGINALLSGEYVLVPRSQWEQVEGGRTDSPPSSSSANDNDDGDDDFLDPAVKARMDKYEQELRDLRESQRAIDEERQRSAQRNIESQQEMLLRAIDTASSKFAIEHGIDTSLVEQIQQVAADRGLLAPNMQRYASPEDAVSATLAEAAWLVEAFRENKLQAELDARTAQQESQAQEAAARKGRAAAVSSSPGSVGRAEAPSPPPRTLHERTKAIAADLDAMMRNKE